MEYTKVESEVVITLGDGVELAVAVLAKVPEGEHYRRLAINTIDCVIDSVRWRCAGPMRERLRLARDDFATGEQLAVRYGSVPFSHAQFAYAVSLRLTFPNRYNLTAIEAGFEDIRQNVWQFLQQRHGLKSPKKARSRKR